MYVKAGARPYPPAERWRPAWRPVAAQQSSDRQTETSSAGAKKQSAARDRFLLRRWKP